MIKEIQRLKEYLSYDSVKDNKHNGYVYSFSKTENPKSQCIEDIEKIEQYLKDYEWYREENRKLEHSLSKIKQTLTDLSIEDYKSIVLRGIK